MENDLGFTFIPDDPISSNHYYYTAQSDGNGYVIGSRLENENSSALKGDVDGMVRGVNCNDPVYCIQLAF